MSKQHQHVDTGTDIPAPLAGEQELQKVWERVVGRRGFLRQAGLASAVAVPATAVAASGASARSRHGLRNEPTAGDFAILRFLCAAEIIESDLWEQYAGFGGQSSSERPHDGKNGFYTAALENLDEDMPQYISDNTDDEESHQKFINGYLMSKGQPPVNLEPFRKLDPSPATGGGSKKVLTNLKKLNVDTSWYLRYRAETNPDFGAMFGQAVTITNQPVIPVSDTETPPGNSAPVPVPSDAAHQRMQAIANSAGFHFAMIEQGGSSLYTALAMKVTSLEVLRIVLAIGGVETNHFSLWHDKAGNAVADPLAGVTDPKTGTTFPNLNNSGGEATQTNLILPEPCEFIPGLPKCSVVRPTIDALAGARAAARALTADGLFDGQSPAFFRHLRRLAREADAAERGVG
jgi:Ferritin-like domain